MLNVCVTQADRFALAIWLQHLRFLLCSSLHVLSPCSLSISLHLSLYVPPFTQLRMSGSFLWVYIFHWWISSFLSFAPNTSRYVGGIFSSFDLFKVCFISFPVFCMSPLTVVLLVFSYTYLNSWVGFFVLWIPINFLEVMGDWIAVCMCYFGHCLF